MIRLKRVEMGQREKKIFSQRARPEKSIGRRCQVWLMRITILVLCDTTRSQGGPAEGLLLLAANRIKNPNAVRWSVVCITSTIRCWDPEHLLAVAREGKG